MAAPEGGSVASASAAGQAAGEAAAADGRAPPVKAARVEPTGANGAADRTPKAPAPAHASATPSAPPAGAAAAAPVATVVAASASAPGGAAPADAAAVAPAVAAVTPAAAPAATAPAAAATQPTATAATAAAGAGGALQASPKAEAKAGGKKKKGKEERPVVPVARRVLSSGLQYEVLKRGSGPMAVPGKTVHVRYEGRLAADGRRFDKGTIRFRLGLNEVIEGWDEGVKGMLQGEVRLLLVPSRLGYGAEGAPPQIPPHAALVFEVELLAG